MGLVQSTQPRANHVNGASHFSDEDMPVHSHDEDDNEVQNEPTWVGVKIELSSLLYKPKELVDLRQFVN